MSIFTDIEEHDYKFESKVIMDKFVAIGGVDYINHDWTIFELRPKSDNNEYKNCDIFEIDYATQTFRSKYHIYDHENHMLVDFLKYEFERYNINTINYPWFIEGELVKIVTLYVIPRAMWKTMEIDFIAMNRPWVELHTFFTKDC